MLYIRLLGGFDVSLDGRLIRENGWPLRRARALVKLLALAPGYWRHRDEILECLWPDSPADAAAHNLHQTLYVARRVLGTGGTHSPILQLHDDLVLLAPEPEVSTDVVEFEAAAGVARIRQDVDLYRRAIEAYGGDLLPGDRYHEWSAAARERVRGIYLSLLWEMADLLESQGDYGAGARVLEELISADGFQEGAYRALMRCYALGGQRTSALRRYYDLKQTLSTELSVEPDDATRELYEAILNGRLPADETRRLPFPGNDTRSSATEAGWDRPPTAHLRGNLPRPTTNLTDTLMVERAIDAVENNRLVTLTGPEGSGKTRLALETALAMIPEFPHGTWLFEVGAAGSAENLRRTVLEVLGAHPVPAGVLRPEQTSLHLEGRQVLVVLDGCDQMAGGSGAVVRELLEGSSGVKVVATAQEPLGIPREAAVEVPALSLPTLPMSRNHLLNYGATRLFLKRLDEMGLADLCPDDLHSVTRICRKVGGLALAVELAAGQVSVHGTLPTETLLDEVFSRYNDGDGPANASQALEATVDLSYRLLSPEEQLLLRQLAVFDGGFLLDEVLAMVWQAGDGSRINQLVTGLAQKALLGQRLDADGAIRYHLPPVVRRGVWKRLTAGEQNSFRARYTGRQLRTTAPAFLPLHTGPARQFRSASGPSARLLSF